jgi:hypothetical protein
VIVIASGCQYNSGGSDGPDVVLGLVLRSTIQEDLTSELTIKINTANG